MFEINKLLQLLTSNKFINKNTIFKFISNQKSRFLLVGGYNLPNVLAAVCIGKTFNVTDDKIKTALENYCPSNSRSQLLKKDGNTIILDAYNANPSSMKEAIVNFEVYGPLLATPGSKLVWVSVTTFARI